ncbi:hypothetical protein SAMN05444171_7845 [Bradyrhizobium lablabi]|uniref:Uncharacterized protein n=1 Tax=Bradyrhizobium lablabi TaxID=722472 RepID=A0A1H5JII7_9BRAD|nr:hypothetical protein SAMN05444171_7845 [Bradyrhizobium lablabi]
MTAVQCLITIADAIPCTKIVGDEAGYARFVDLINLPAGHAILAVMTFAAVYGALTLFRHR